MLVCVSVLIVWLLICLFKVAALVRLLFLFETLPSLDDFKELPSAMTERALSRNLVNSLQLKRDNFIKVIKYKAELCTDNTVETLPLLTLSYMVDTSLRWTHILVLAYILT